MKRVMLHALVLAVCGLLALPVRWCCLTSNLCCAATKAAAAESEPACPHCSTSREEPAAPAPSKANCCQGHRDLVKQDSVSAERDEAAAAYLAPAFESPLSVGPQPVAFSTGPPPKPPHPPLHVRLCVWLC